MSATRRPQLPGFATQFQRHRHLWLAAAVCCNIACRPRRTGEEERWSNGRPVKVAVSPARDHRQLGGVRSIVAQALSSGAAVRSDLSTVITRLPAANAAAASSTTRLTGEIPRADDARPVASVPRRPSVRPPDPARSSLVAPSIAPHGFSRFSITRDDANHPRWNVDADRDRVPKSVHRRGERASALSSSSASDGFGDPVLLDRQRWRTFLRDGKRSC